MSSLGRMSLLVLGAAVSGVLLIVSLFVTNPLAIGPLGVTVWFVLLLLSLGSGLTLGLYGIKTFLRLHDNGGERLRHSTRQGFLLAGWVTGILALSSLHQFNLRDAILLGLLLGIVELYVRFRWS
jgi:hypothetical protein